MPVVASCGGIIESGPTTEFKMNTFNINRRRFLQSGSGALAMSALGAYGVELVNRKP